MCTSQAPSDRCPSARCPSFASYAASIRASAAAATASAWTSSRMYCPSTSAGKLAASISAREPTKVCSFASTSPPLAGSAMVHIFCLTSPEALFRQGAYFNCQVLDDLQYCFLVKL